MIRGGFDLVATFYDKFDADFAREMFENRKATTGY
jgi:hypothetical protein